MQLIQTLKESNQDHEFYPTTDAIIRAMINDIGTVRAGLREYGSRLDSVIDVGAGNGKVLSALKEADLSINHYFAIEKSPILAGLLPDHVLIVGAEFEQQSLISKPVGIVFSNPPYSVFEEWTVKIIREANAKVVYLVIPVRWANSVDIAQALKFRGAKAEIVGDFDFLNAEDRQARARVHLLRVLLSEAEDDAFERFFDEAFGGLNQKFEQAARKQAEESPQAKFSELVVGATYPETLVSLYQLEMENVQKNYAAVSTLDVGIMSELNVSPSSIMASLKARLAGLRNLYWKEIFDRLNTITDRLTSKNRKALLETLQKHVHVDFTVSNIHLIVLWVLRHANQYLDAQLVEVFDEMVDAANVKNYASNRVAFVCDRWRYANRRPEERKGLPSHFMLEYRIVLQHMGGVGSSSYSWEKGLTETGSHFIGDLLTVARNLGFVHLGRPHHHYRNEWIPGKPVEFHFVNSVTGKSEVLLEVKGFKNRNMHIRLNQRFALALNVECGRLKGWLKSGQEAAAETGEPEAARAFASHFRLPMTNVLCLEQ